MSIHPLEYLFLNAPQIVMKLARIEQAEAEGSPILDPITAFLDLFANVNIGGLMAELGAGVTDLLTPQNEAFYLGLTGIEVSPTTPTEPRRPIRGGPIIRSAPPDSGESTTVPPESEGTPTYQTPEEVVEKLRTERTETAKPKVTKREPFTKEASVTVVDEEVLLLELNKINIFHTFMVLATSITAVIVEIASLGQVDRLLEPLQSAYSLLDTSSQFYAAQGARVDISFERPYRYWLESRHMNNVPPPADLGRFLARETMLPDEYTDTMRFWGFSDFWSDKYRRSRFIELPAETIFKAHHYGLIGPEEVLRLLRIADYNPEQVPLLNELAYDYPNRTELRLMARRSSIPEELVASALATSGLRPEYQPYLIETLENWDVASLLKAKINEGIAQFERGFIQADRLTEIAVANEASPVEAENYVGLATIRRDGRRKQDRTKTIRTAFRHGLLTPTEDYRAEIEQYLPDLAFEEATEADIYRVLMLDIGYDNIDIEIMLDDDRIRSKNVETIESLDELLALMKESE